jgi:hypothetical protein
MDGVSIGVGVVVMVVSVGWFKYYASDVRLKGAV